MKSFSFIHAGPPERLDKLVVSHAPSEFGVTRSQIERWIESGCVQIHDKVVVKAGVRVDPGTEVRVSPPLPSGASIEPMEFPLRVLFEDAHLLVIDKPRDLTMHPGAGNPNRTLVNAVVAHVGAAQAGVGSIDRPGVVHRLDKDTTGVVVVAKTIAAHSSLAAQFAERTVGRAYRALVFTTPRANRLVQKSDSGEVELAIGRHPTDRKRMSVNEAGRPSVTRWKVLERFNYGTLLECSLKTGRTHQIRVHMEAIGSPVIGDRVYGDFSGLPRPLYGAATVFGRQALHAATLSFTHPASGERLSFTSPDPEDLVTLLDAFRGYR